MKKIVLLLVIGACMSGCATSGRLAVVDLDLRSPEQIKAYEVEAQVPYELNEVVTGATTNSVNDVVSADAPKVSPIWEFLAPILEAFKGRLRILSFEWRNK